MPEMAIETKGLSKRFGKTEVLTKADLKIPKGVVACLLGPQQGGKTSLFKLLMGEYRPSEGGGSVLGMDITQHGQAIRQRIGYMPQADGFDESASVQRVIDLTASLHKHTTAQRAEALEMVGLTDKVKTRVKHLSATERRKLGLARAYVTRPALLLLDEPADGLDPLERIELFETIQNMRANITILFSDHVTNRIETLAEYVIFLIGGHIVQQSSLETLLNSQGTPTDLEQVYIDLLRKEKATS